MLEISILTKFFSYVYTFTISLQISKISIYKWFFLGILHSTLSLSHILSFAIPNVHTPLAMHHYEFYNGFIRSYFFISLFILGDSRPMESYSFYNCIPPIHPRASFITFVCSSSLFYCSISHHQGCLATSTLVWLLL